MPYTKKKSYLLNYETIRQFNKESLKAFCFLPEVSGKKQKALRLCLKEQGIVLHYIKLNIVKKLLKKKNILGINNRVALIIMNKDINPKDLYYFLTKNNIILNLLFIKNIIIHPEFLLEEKRFLINFNMVLNNSGLFIKKVLFKIITINNVINVNK